MESLSDIQDPLLKKKRSVAQRLGWGASTLIGSIFVQVLAIASLVILAPYCSIAPLPEEKEEVVEITVINFPQPEEEKEAEKEDVKEEPEVPKEKEPEKIEKPKEKIKEPKKKIEKVKPDTKEPEKSDTKDEVEKPGPVNLDDLEGLTADSLSNDGAFSMKSGKGIHSGRITKKYIDPKKKIYATKDGTGDGASPVKITQKCRDKKAKIKSRKKGKYPVQAQRKRLEGSVVARLNVNAAGKVTQVNIVKGAGNGFDESAKKAFFKWTFYPAEKNCKKVSSIKRTTHSFTLQ